MRPIERSAKLWAILLVLLITAGGCAAQVRSESPDPKPGQKNTVGGSAVIVSPQVAFSVTGGIGAVVLGAAVAVVAWWRVRRALRAVINGVAHFAPARDHQIYRHIGWSADDLGAKRALKRQVRLTLRSVGGD